MSYVGSAEKKGIDGKAGVHGEEEPQTLGRARDGKDWNPAELGTALLVVFYYTSIVSLFWF